MESIRRLNDEIQKIVFLLDYLLWLLVDLKLFVVILIIFSYY